MNFTPTTPRIAYEQSTGRGPRVLFIMGFGMRGAVWQPQIEGLGEQLHMAWFDNRGMGESDPVGPLFRMADLAADAASVANALGWDEFHVVGVSLGGMIAQELALSQPSRVLSLTLIATHSGGLLGVLPTARGLYHWVNAAFGREHQRVNHLVSLLYPASFVAAMGAKTLMDRMRGRVGNKPPRRTALAQLYAVIRHNTSNRLRAIAAPTLVIQPTGDLLVRPFHSARLAKLVPGARLLPVAEGGHGLTFHAAAEVNAAILAHVLAATAKAASADGAAPESVGRSA